MKQNDPPEENNKLMEDVPKDNHFYKIINELKKASNYYPSILIREYVSQFRSYDIYASTLIRIKRDGIYYVVHLVESINAESTNTEEDLLLRIMESAHNVSHLHVVNDTNDDIDVLQISEASRLINEHKKP